LSFQVGTEIVLRLSILAKVVGNHVLCLFRSIVWLVILLVDSFLDHALRSILLYLVSQIAQVFEVIVLLHLFVVLLDDVLLSLLPAELFLLENASFLNVLTFVLKPGQSLLVGLLDVGYVVRPTRMGMVKHAEWTLRPHEVWVLFRVVLL
jgi:hypothetical protein